MIEFLFLSVSLRFLLFDHYSFKWFRFLLGRGLFLFPNYWKELEKCSFCNGFWVSLGCYILLFGFHLLALRYALIGAFACYWSKLLSGILEDHPANKVEGELHD